MTNDILVNREHEGRWGKTTTIRIAPGPYNSVVIRKMSNQRAMRDDPTTWRPAIIIVVEQHFTPDEAALLQDAIGKAIEEAKYLDEKYPPDSPVASAATLIVEEAVVT